MSLFQAISDFFESLFNKNSPEVQKKIQLRKLENELKAQEPLIFKNAKVMPNFAEAMRILCQNTKPLADLFGDTIFSPDVHRNLRFEAQLVMTGFSENEQAVVESLEYENRKKQLSEVSALTTSQIFDNQHKNLEKITKLLQSDTFRKIDRDINILHQLSDFCKYNYVTVLQIFDPNFVAADKRYSPSYHEISIDRILNILEDFYFVLKGLTLTTSTLNAISALATLKSGGNSLNSNAEVYKDCIKHIAFIINHVLAPERIRLLICYGKADINYQPQISSYNDSARKHFNDMLQSKFKSDEQRIKTELKDNKINSELSKLFGSTELLKVSGYNSDINAKLLANSQLSLTWLMPVRILKTFLATFISEPIKTLLNDIVVEGFFNNPQYKSDFASSVFAALESAQSVADFEASFERGGRNAVSKIEGFIHDSHNDPEFFKKLEQMVSNITTEAGKHISHEINNIRSLSHHIEGILQDSKKPTCEIISNLKVLMMSSRNKDNTDLLEQQFPKWEIFFEIMKNNAIISG